MTNLTTDYLSLDTMLHQKKEHSGVTSDERRKRLRKLLNTKLIIRTLEVHNGLTGLIVENLKVNINDQMREFDAMWSSSLTT